MVFPAKRLAWERVGLDIKMDSKVRKFAHSKPIGRRAVETTYACMCACLHIN